MEKNSAFHKTPLWQVVDDVGDGAIGLYDSGIGGTTVLSSLVAKYPGEKYLYFADTIAHPYGTKKPQDLLDRIDHSIHFLLSRRVKQIVVACHTASLFISSHWQKQCPIPLIHMVDATIATAQHHRQKNRPYCLWGTDLTIASGEYQKKLSHSTFPLRHLETPLSPLVAWIEKGRNTEYGLSHLQQEKERLIAHSCYHIILACTHFPLILPELDRFFGPSFSFINPADLLNAQTASFCSLRHEPSSPSLVEFATSGDKKQFNTVYKQYWRCS